MQVEVHAGYHYFTADADNDNINKIEEFDDNGNAYVEMLLPAETAKLIADSEPPPGACYRLRVYIAHDKKAVVD